METTSNILRQRLIESWTYPALESPPAYAGRLVGLGEKISLEWEGKRHDFLFENLKFEPPIYAEAMQVGDLVAVELNSDLRITRINLLAPSQAKSPQIFAQGKNWSEFLSKLRRFFEREDFIELKTPSFVVCPGTEPYLRPFSVRVQQGKKSVVRYLPTSPELHLKKHLNAGHSKIFELKECFRNEEVSNFHQPEFMMLEWYRAFSNLDSIIFDLQNLLNELAKNLGASGPKLQVVSMRELFRKYLDFDLAPTTSDFELRKLCEKFEISFLVSDNWDELFFRLFLEKIESQISDQALIVRNYPPRLAAYSRLNSDGWADRFEFYWKGLEIANAFHEVNDPHLQRRRMQEDNERKLVLGLEPVPLDEEFLECLAAGFPPSGGIALGVERLFMAFYDLRSIGEVRPFCYGDNR